MKFAPSWRCDVEEMADEEVVALVLAVGFAHSVAGTGDDHEVEVLVGTCEGGRKLHGGRGIDIVVEFANDKHEGSCEAGSILDVGALDVR